MVKVKCKKCGHEWNTKGKLILINCSCCGHRQKIAEIVIDDNERKKFRAEEQRKYNREPK